MSQGLNASYLRLNLVAKGLVNLARRAWGTQVLQTEIEMGQRGPPGAVIRELAVRGSLPRKLSGAEGQVRKTRRRADARELTLAGSPPL